MPPIKIVSHPNPILRKVCDDIDPKNPGSLASKLTLMMNMVNGFAVAAPQIGQAKRAFIYKISGFGSGLIYNPEIIYSSEEQWTYYEGCLSIPGKFWNLERPRFITVKYENKAGERLTIDLEDLPARVFQHEIDHLNGILIIDHIKKIALAENFQED